MSTQLIIADIPAVLTRKPIKHIYLRVSPPAGAVSISAPLQASEERIRIFALSQLAWLKKQIEKMRGQAREPEREFLNRETHYIWGRPCLLQLGYGAAKNRVFMDYDILHIELKDDNAKPDKILEAWRRKELLKAAQPLMLTWAKRMQLTPPTLACRAMRTRWGSCHYLKGRIILNTELSKKDRAHLEYVIVHELTHLLVPNHGKKFVAYMDHFMPDWQIRSQQLNRLPLKQI